MELEKLYNNETVLAIREFIVDFQAIFPGLLSEEELINRIITNMKHNIDFNADLDDKVMGEFSNGKVFIRKDIKEKGQVLFHEMIHVITHGNFVKEFGYINFIEGIVTLAEEMYVRYKGIKMPVDRRNVNGYIPTFVREINFVKDGELLRAFIKDPAGIYKLFLPKLLKYKLPFGNSDDDYFFELRNIARCNENIVLMAKNRCSDQEICPSIKRLEEDILDQYISSVIVGNEKFNGDKYLMLYNMQLYPNIMKFIDGFNEFISNGLISSIDINKCGKLGVFYSLCSNDTSADIRNINVDVSHFTNNELEWLASRVFGFSNYLYDSQELIDVDVDIDKLFDEIDYYNEVMPIYRQIMEGIICGDIDIDSIRNCNLRRSKISDNSYSAFEYLLNIEKSANERLLEVIFGVLGDKLGIYCLEDNEGIKVIRNGEFFYYPNDSISFLTRIMVCKSNYSELIYNYMKKYSDCDVIYCDSVIEMDIEDFSGCDINIFVLKGTDLFKVKLSLVEGSIKEEVSLVKFMDNGKSLFEKDTSNKLKLED